MWGRRGKRGTKLSRQLALGLLEDAMGQVQDPRREPEQPGSRGARAPSRRADPELPDQARQAAVRVTVRAVTLALRCWLVNFR